MSLGDQTNDGLVLRQSRTRGVRCKTRTFNPIASQKMLNLQRSSVSIVGPSDARVMQCSDASGDSELQHGLLASFEHNCLYGRHPPDKFCKILC